MRRGDEGGSGARLREGGLLWEGVRRRGRGRRRRGGGRGRGSKGRVRGCSGGRRGRGRKRVHRQRSRSRHRMRVRVRVRGRGRGRAIILRPVRGGGGGRRRRRRRRRRGRREGAPAATRGAPAATRARRGGGAALLAPPAEAGVAVRRGAARGVARAPALVVAFTAARARRDGTPIAPRRAAAAFRARLGRHCAREQAELLAREGGGGPSPNVPQVHGEEWGRGGNTRAREGGAEGGGGGQNRPSPASQCPPRAPTVRSPRRRRSGSSNLET